MKNNIKVSIITPSFNSVKTIEKTILSVLGQHYDNVEYIIIDGGSTDGTIDIIKKYEDKISYWVSEKDSGISDAFNKGVIASSGDIVGIINSDDWYEENILSYIVDVFLSNNIDCFFGGLRYWSSDDLNFVVMSDKNYYKKIRYRAPSLYHPTCFFKKEIYNNIGLFSLSYKYAMDCDMFLRAYNYGAKFFISDKIISNMNLGGASDKNAIRLYLEIFKISEKKVFSFFYVMFAILKHYIKKIVLFLGLNILLNKIRRFKYGK